MCTKWHDTRETAKIKCQKGETNDSLSFVTDVVIHADVFSVSARCDSCRIWRTAFRHDSLTAWSKMFTGHMNCHWSDLAVVHQHSKRHGANQRSDGDGSLKSIRHLDWHNLTKGEWAYIANDNNCSRNAHN